MAFADAKQMKKPAGPAKGSKKEREVVEMANTKQLAHLVALQKAVAGAIKAVESTMKEEAMDVFLGTACSTGAKPESVDAVEDNARINVQFKKRTTLSPFSVEELRGFCNALKIKHDKVETGTDEEADELVALIEKNAGITIPKNVKTQKLYAIDPDQAEDEEKMKKVEAVLKRNGLDGIIVVQNEVKTYIATDELMAIACSKKNSDLIRPLATIGFKPVLENVDPKELLKTASEVLDVAIKLDFDEKAVEKEVSGTSKAAAKKKPARKVAALESK